MSTVATLVVLLQGNIRGFTRSLDLAEARLAGFGKSAGASAAFLGVGAAATAAGVVVAAMAAKMAIDFESAMIGVRKTVDATEEEFASLTQAVRDMAKEIPASTTEIAGVAEAAGQLGVQVENIEAFVRVMIELGVATDISAKDGAIAMARFANVMQEPIERVDQITDALVTLGNNLEANEAEILGLASRLTGLGSVIGLTSEDVLGLAAGMKALGIPAELGATAFQRFGLIVKTAVGEAGEDLDEFARVAGLSAEEFTRQFSRDPARALLGFVRGLGELEDAGLNSITVLKNLGLGSQRTVQVMTKMAAAVDKMDQALDLANDTLETAGARSLEAGRRFDSAASKISVAVNKVKDAMISLGQAIVPHVLNGLKLIEAWFEKNGNDLRATFSQATPAAAVLAGAIANVVRGFGAWLTVMTQLRLLLIFTITLVTALAVAIGFLAPALVPFMIAAGVLIASMAALGFVIDTVQTKGRNLIDMWVEFGSKAMRLVEVSSSEAMDGLLDDLDKVNAALAVAETGLEKLAAKEKELADAIRAARGEAPPQTIQSEALELAVKEAITAATLKLAQANVLLRDETNGLTEDINTLRGPMDAIEAETRRLQRAHEDAAAAAKKQADELANLGIKAFLLKNIVGEVSRATEEGAGMGDFGFDPELLRIIRDLAEKTELEQTVIENLARVADPGNILGLFTKIDESVTTIGTSISKLQQSISAFENRRLVDEIEAFLRGGDKGLLALQKKNKQIDLEFIKFVNTAAQFGLTVTATFRQAFSDFLNETETGAQRIEGLLAFLVARRLGQGLDPGGGLVQFTPGAVSDARSQFGGGGDTNIVENLTIIAAPDGTLPQADGAVLLAGEGARQANRGVGLNGEATE